MSTISRQAVIRGVPGANFTQMLSSIPGAISATNDVTGLSDGNFTVRGFPADEVGVTLNGVPLNDSGDYTIYATEYGDTENMGDITVEQGYPGVTSPVIGAAGGNIAWVTVDPTADAGLDLSQSLGSNNYKRTFLRYNTGDSGPVRSWLSYSNNQTDHWRGDGQSTVNKIDAKSVCTLDDGDVITGARNTPAMSGTTTATSPRSRLPPMATTSAMSSPTSRPTPVTGSARGPTRSAAGSPASTVSSH